MRVVWLIFQYSFFVNRLFDMGIECFFAISRYLGVYTSMPIVNGGFMKKLLQF